MNDGLLYWLLPELLVAITVLNTLMLYTRPVDPYLSPVLTYILTSNLALERLGHAKGDLDYRDSFSSK